jgi:hypothetical protein
MIFVGGLGLLGFGLGPSLAARSAGAARLLMIGSDALERLTLLALAVFVWQVFGRGGPSRAFLLAAVLVAMTANWTWVLLFQQWPAPMAAPAVEVASQLVFAAPLTWSAVEAWLERRRSLRRPAPDAFASHRFLLWSVGSASFALICFTTAFIALLPDESAIGASLTVLRAAFYAVTAATVALGFFPPEGYRRWVAPAPSAQPG